MASLDRIVLKDLKTATELHAWLRAVGEPIELWEALRLAKTCRAPSPPPASLPADDPVRLELEAVRRQLGPLVKAVREFLLRVPNLPERGERLEMALAFLLANSREHAAVARWPAEPEEHLRKAGDKLRGLAAIADPYRDALLPWQLDPPAAEGPAAAAERPPVTVDPAVLSDLRSALGGLQGFREAMLEVEFWEIFLLLTAERLPTQGALDRMRNARSLDTPAAFHQEVRALYLKIVSLRGKNTRAIQALREYLGGLPEFRSDPDSLEWALGYIASTPEVREKFKAWAKGAGRNAYEGLQGILDQVTAWRLALRETRAE